MIKPKTEDMMKKLKLFAMMAPASLFAVSEAKARVTFEAEIAAVGEQARQNFQNGDLHSARGGLIAQAPACRPWSFRTKMGSTSITFAKKCLADNTPYMTMEYSRARGDHQSVFSFDSNEYPEQRQALSNALLDRTNSGLTRRDGWVLRNRVMPEVEKSEDAVTDPDKQAHIVQAKLYWKDHLLGQLPLPPGI